MAAIDLCNMALTRIGADTITDFTTEPHGPVCSLFYDEVRRAMLMEDTWRFAVRWADFKAEALVTQATVDGALHRVTKTAGAFDWARAGDMIQVGDTVCAVASVASDGSYLDCPRLDTDVSDVDVNLVAADGKTGFRLDTLTVTPLRILTVTDWEQTPVAWRMDGDRLYAQAREARAQYVGDVEDPALFPSPFVYAFVVRLATMLTIRVKASQSLYDRLAAEYEQAMLRAREINAILWDDPDGDEHGSAAWIDARTGGAA